MEAEKKDLVRWCARPYVTAVVGPVTLDVDTRVYADWKHGRAWAAESFGRGDTWGFSPDLNPRHLDLGSISAFDSVGIVFSNRYTEAEGLDYTGVLAIESLASWCVCRVLTYPASDGRVLVSGLDYVWEVWDIVVGDRHAVLGLAIPDISQPVVSRAQSREDAGVWARQTFGPAFLPFDLASGWSCVERGRADKNRFSYSWGRSEKEWAADPGTWNVWR